MSEFYSIKPCKSSNAWEFSPKKSMKLDLKKMSNRFKNVEIATMVILIFNMNGIKVSLYPSGRMLIHTKDKKKAELIFNEVMKVIS
jgi:ribonuclease HIII